MPQKISADIIRICKVCGQEFHPTARKQFCCNQIKTDHCVICNNPISYKCNTSFHKRTCSAECNKLFIKNKVQASISTESRICKWCGKEFIPKSSRSVYCDGPHYNECVICGSKFEIDVVNQRDTKTCSKECFKILQLQNRDIQEEQKHLHDTLISKYGVANPMQIPDVLQKIKQTNLSKYGTEWYTQTEEYKEKLKKTSLAKYNVDHHLSSSSVMSKRKDTCLMKYGVENVSQAKEVKQKIVSSFRSIYGIDNAGQRNISDIDNWNKFIQNPSKFIKCNYVHPPTVADLMKRFNVTATAIYNHIDITNNPNLLSHSYSMMEDDIVDYLHSLCIDNIVRNDRKCISPYELDIYLPDYKIGIECNPTITHNSSIKDPWKGDPKSYNYHQMKTDMCEEKGIFLLHVFGHEWAYKREIIKSIIRNILGQNLNKVYARKCEVREVSYKDSILFLNDNHRQGFANSPVRLGLYYEETLVSLMTFGKMRHTIGTSKKEDLSECWELVRFCNTMNTTVVGGASKLFKAFVTKYNPKQIRSFSDRAHTKGSLYRVLGFNELRKSDPGYMWVNLITDIPVNRIKVQKSNISKLFPDELIDTTKSENEIMIEHDFVKMYDCGSIVWEWIA